MKYAIITDSGCDLISLGNTDDKEILFDRVPISIVFGDTVIPDKIDTNVKAAIKQIREYPGKTGSAAPGPKEWVEIMKQADEVFVVTITSKLSGTYNSALIGKELCLEEYPEKKIHVFDSLSASAQIVLIVEHIKKMIMDGNNFETIVDSTDTYIGNTSLTASVCSLDTFIKNGRVKKSVGKLAGIAGIKMIVEVLNGQLEVFKKCRGKRTIYDKIIKRMIEKNYIGGKVVITHSENPEDVEYVKGLIRGLYKDAQITVLPTSTLCSYYIEDRGIIIGYEIN